MSDNYFSCRHRLPIHLKSVKVKTGFKVADIDLCVGSYRINSNVFERCTGDALNQDKSLPGAMGDGVVECHNIPSGIWKRIRYRPLHIPW